MFNYQSLGDNMSALRANQKTQVLILHGVYAIPKMTDTISSTEKAIITFKFKFSCKVPLLPIYRTYLTSFTTMK